MASIDSRYVCIFGGWDTNDGETEVFQSDAKLLDTVSWSWADARYAFICVGGDHDKGIQCSV